MDLCASVHFLRDAVEGPSFIFDEDIYIPEPPTDSLEIAQKKATLILADHCRQLRRVYWSSWAEVGVEERSNVWIWRIAGEEELNSPRTMPSGAVECEGTGQRALSYEQTYHSMRPLVLFEPRVKTLNAAEPSKNLTRLNGPATS